MTVPRSMGTRWLRAGGAERQSQNSMKRGELRATYMCVFVMMWGGFRLGWFGCQQEWGIENRPIWQQSTGSQMQDPIKLINPYISTIRAQGELGYSHQSGVTEVLHPV